jgi:hypothetical protein
MAALSLSLPKRWQPASVWLLYVVGLLPAAWTFYLGATDQLGADPVKTFERFLGPLGDPIPDPDACRQPCPRSAGLELPALSPRAWASLFLLRG